MNILVRISAVVSAALLTLCSVPVETRAASASAKIDMSKKGSLNVTHYSVDNELMADVPSHLYLVATIDGNGQYTITDDFKGCFADQDFFNNGYDYDSWKSCVSYDESADSDNLYDYVRANNIPEVKSAVSDDSGNENKRPENITVDIYQLSWLTNLQYHNTSWKENNTCLNF